MAKKCIPGVFCIENMTLFILFCILLLVIYLFISLQTVKSKELVVHNSILNPQNTIPLAPTIGPIQAISTRNDPFNDPYYPPLKMDSLFYPSTTSDIRYVPQIPINIQTRYPQNQMIMASSHLVAPQVSQTTGYTQIGILTSADSTDKGKDKLILPLMGRRNYNGRDKWQYYTISNSGNLNTKLPISFHGRSCINENGCDEIYNNDIVYVEGYKDKFSVTIYENGMYSYIPVL